MGRNKYTGLLLFPSWNSDFKKNTVRRGESSYVKQHAFCPVASFFFLDTQLNASKCSLFLNFCSSWRKRKPIRWQQRLSCSSRSFSFTCCGQLGHCSNSFLEWISRCWCYSIILLYLVTRKYKWRLKVNSGERELVLSDHRFLKLFGTNMIYQFDFLCNTDHCISSNYSCTKLVCCGWTGEHHSEWNPILI